jgi:hypothetical protein
MNEIISCPACQRKVQLPPEFIGRSVQCPECKHTFVAAVASTAVSAEAAPVPAPPPSPMLDTQVRSRRSRYSEFEEDEPFDEWGQRRAASRQDRGGMILAFGIMAVVAPCFLGLVFGPIAWFMGTTDLAAIDAGEMNAAARGLVQAGRITGVIGFCLNCFSLLATIAYFVFIFSMMGG